ncbi:hypothetical protein [Lentzea pudingi]|uniref:hypothetical protein n=1 Tax=Lentzea pudingi TaxID=1789439 RepID=UPI00166F002B|nr:hypothetical protein [Lentzea pudingi]
MTLLTPCLLVQRLRDPQTLRYHCSASLPGDRWTDDILPLVLDPADPLGTLDLTTHRIPLADATRGYEIFRAKSDGCIKVVLTP